MKSSRVPQDNISTYGGNKKAIYATNADGSYSLVASSGWDIEGAATGQALQEFERLTDEARAEVAAGRRSPLFFHMHNCRMDLQVLAESTGLFKWRIKKHFRPAVFEKLATRLLQRYSSALGISIDELRILPQRAASDD